MPYALEYNNISQRKISGCWIVPYINGVFLIKKDLINKIGNFYSKNRRTGTIEGLDSELDRGSITFCANLLENGFLSYVDNRNMYGHLSV